MSRRRDQVLDAAIEVLGTEGSRRLTYQAVDSAAGVPAGTTSNYFRNRDALINSVVTHIETLDRLDWESFAASLRPADIDELAGALTGFVLHATGPGRARTAARYALFLEALGHPELRVSLARSRAMITDWGVHWIRQLGSPTPTEHCQLLLDYLDGLMLHQIAMPEPNFDPTPAIRTILAGLISQQRPSTRRAHPGPSRGPDRN